MPGSVKEMRRLWLPEAAVLRRHCSVYAVDGHGVRPGGQHRHVVEATCSDLDALVAAIGPE